MKDLSTSTIIKIFCFAGIFTFLLVMAQRQEHAEDVAVRMSQEQYDTIKGELGEGADIVDITSEYERRCSTKVVK